MTPSGCSGSHANRPAIRPRRPETPPRRARRHQTERVPRKAGVDAGVQLTKASASSGKDRVDQSAIGGRPMIGLSVMGAIVSRVM